MGYLCKVVLKIYKFKEFLKIARNSQVFKKKLPHTNEAYYAWYIKKIVAYNNEKLKI